jgi:hypothetical protein
VLKGDRTYQINRREKQNKGQIQAEKSVFVTAELKL